MTFPGSYVFIYFYSVFFFFSKECGEPTVTGSPKFIVTLDGVPSPLGNMADVDVDVDVDMELEAPPPRPPAPVSSRLGLQAKVSVLQRLQGGFNMADG